MSTTLECHIGRASDTVPFSPAFSSGPAFINMHFGAATKGRLNITPINHLQDGPLVRPDAALVNALDLHKCVQRLTKNLPYQKRVSRIALILADRYNSRPGIFGVMFDRGMATSDDPNSSSIFTSTPREGCAIFLGAIRELRPSDIEFNREVEFTTIHEMGHIFNLGHSNLNCFMHPSLVSGSFPNNYFSFSTDESLWLSECDTNPLVYPGGSPFTPVAGDNTPRNGKPSTRLDLIIDIQPSIFATIHPVELSLSLSAREGAVYVPDRIDPGYPEFVIWITRPDGTRTRYRSPRKYCSPPRRIKINAAAPFRRDISISEHSGGRTFSVPGKYQIEISFAIRKNEFVRSNICDIEVVSSRKLLSDERILLFSKQSIRSFLYFRPQSPTFARQRSEIIQHLRREPTGLGVNTLRYALIRASCREERRNKRNVSQILELIEAMRNSEDEIGTRQWFHVNDIEAALLKNNSRHAEKPFSS